MEFDCRKDGYYDAIIIEDDGQLSIQKVLSVDGKIYSLQSREITGDKVKVIFIDSRNSKLS